MHDLFQRTIPEVLFRSAQATPDKPAFICGDASLTYAEIVHKALQLAQVLAELGVQKGDRVGVLLNQSLESAVAVHGIMAAGAAFVPVDPTAPARRVAYILDRCDVAVLVSQPSKRDVIDETVKVLGRGIALIGMDAADAKTQVSWDQVYAASPAAPADITSQDLSYIMWTSGSTGEPKGMTHTHGNGLIYAGMLAETHDLNSDDRFLGMSPLHFDMCVMDYVTAPLVGGTTIIVPESVGKMPAALAQLAAKQRATVMYSVPFAMTQMLERGGMEALDLTAMRWMIYGGEAFALRQLRALQELLPHASFANAFGPAETHQISSYTIPPVDDTTETIPVGIPWRTLLAIVVDEDDQEVTRGEVGELLVRSPSCMLGYWDDPALTAEAMLVRPRAGGLSDTFYRTGDLVRQEPDGMMHFLGRKGRQIKLRGYRVELDEVEAAVLEHGSVAECAVVRNSDGLTLIGFVRLNQPQENAVTEIVNLCKARLPGYAVPSHFELVTAFPRTGSGKIDKKSLAENLPAAQTKAN